MLLSEIIGNVLAYPVVMLIFMTSHLSFEYHGIYYTNTGSNQITKALYDNKFSHICHHIWQRKEGNVLFNDALNTFYLRLYGVRHMVKYHTDSERGNPLPPHGLLFPIYSKGSFICTIPQTGLHIPRPLLHQSWSTGWNEK